eukprot:CAMPEP_0115214550 /NCGR_PEP_ID=MMETSP0270-20121206/24361_2 /TAXON_ID=71861 /ORGANISM="Scrippsiella trochoidea, Strain CCMP3099" /LENGTH=222 /DNA_ID=CAMNT_0002628321 /DNA_START=435 /DNA_END=1099 /DNA_ORIENTATION=-
MDSPPEVCNLEGIVSANQDVFWLNVAVDDVLRMAILDCLREKSLSPALQFRIQLTPGCHLQHEVHSPLIVEVIVQPQYVHMPAMRLDLDLAGQLVLDAVPDQLDLVKDFQCKYESGSSAASHVNVSELARAKSFAHVNVVQCEPWSLDWHAQVLVAHQAVARSWYFGNIVLHGATLSPGALLAAFALLAVLLAQTMSSSNFRATGRRGLGLCSHLKGKTQGG